MRQSLFLSVFPSRSLSLSDGRTEGGIGRARSWREEKSHLCEEMHRRAIGGRGENGLVKGGFSVKK